MKVLINASNLHVGGGVQVASSFISELFSMSPEKYEDINVFVYASSEVNENLELELIDNCNHIEYQVVDTWGLSLLSKEIKEKFLSFDLCFTIFGPNYHLGLSKIDVVGFAQPWIAYPNNQAYNKISLPAQIKNKFKFFLQKAFFFRTQHLIVEHNDVERALRDIGYSGQVSVVSNCISSIYLDRKRWGSISGLPIKTKFTFGFVGRAYSHKNLEVISKVDSILKSKYKLDVDYLFTLDNDEFERIGFSKNSNFRTVGSISISQCPAFYEYIDSLIFPSLLECFSATPIEAMYMGKPVFASDLSFVREICKDSAIYFDPTCAEDIAEKIYLNIANKETIRRNVISAKKLVGNLPNAKDRADSYLSLIKNYLGKNYV
ncbi:glycosyltransferase [Vibrio diazotrophicus]|uniref:glycosyltransferase n=1 Tax=Vibrio diazotrophicus TaxID=685 RepID=UPI000C9E0909|nr:glycosyltransferase [Vibrio diazotrophicus]PNH94613.1 glycosyl transferase family 1 [Vibrio diazotrophicus]